MEERASCFVCIYLLVGGLKAVYSGSAVVLFIANDHFHCQCFVERSQLYLLFLSAIISIISCSSWQQTSWDEGYSSRAESHKAQMFCGWGKRNVMMGFSVPK